MKIVFHCKKCNFSKITFTLISKNNYFVAMLLKRLTCTHLFAILIFILFCTENKVHYKVVFVKMLFGKIKPQNSIFSIQIKTTNVFVMIVH